MNTHKKWMVIPALLTALTLIVTAVNCLTPQTVYADGPKECRLEFDNLLNGALYDAEFASAYGKVEYSLNNTDFTDLQEVNDPSGLSIGHGAHDGKTEYVFSYNGADSFDGIYLKITPAPGKEAWIDGEARAAYTLETGQNKNIEFRDEGSNPGGGGGGGQQPGGDNFELCVQTAEYDGTKFTFKEGSTVLGTGKITLGGTAKTDCRFTVDDADKDKTLRIELTGEGDNILALRSDKIGAADVSYNGNSVIYTTTFNTLKDEHDTVRLNIDYCDGTDIGQHSYHGYPIDRSKLNVFVLGNDWNNLINSSDNAYKAYYSTDNGRSWTQITSRIFTFPTANNPNNCIKVDFPDNKTVQMNGPGGYESGEKIQLDRSDNYVIYANIPATSYSVDVFRDSNVDNAHFDTNGVKVAYSTDGSTYTPVPIDGGMVTIPGDPTSAKIKITTKAGYYAQLFASDGGDYGPDVNDRIDEGKTVICDITKFGTYHVQVMDDTSFNVSWADNPQAFGEDAFLEHGKIDIISADKVQGDGDDNDGMITGIDGRGYGTGYTSEKGDGWVFIKPGSKVTVHATPDYGYQFIKGEISGCDVQGVDGQEGYFTFTMPVGMVHARGIFEEFEDETQVASDVADVVSDASIADGQNASEVGNVRLSVSKTDLTADEKATAESKVSDATVQDWISLDLDRFIKNGSVESEGTTPLAEFEKPVTVSLKSSDVKAGNEYVIIREHDGTLEELPAEIDGDAGTITFQTNKFSNYAIAIKGTTETKTRTVIKKGLTDAVITADLKNAGFTSTAQIEKALREALVKKAPKMNVNNSAVYDIEGQVLVNGTWTSDPEILKDTKFEVVIPYPEGTNRKNYKFTVIHMFGMNSTVLNHKAGDTEAPTVILKDDGIHVTLNGLSPVIVGWEKAGKSPKTGIPEQMPVALVIMMAGFMAYFIKRKITS